LLNDKLFLVL